MPELTKHIKEFLRFTNDEEIIYIYNKEDDMYYTIDECRIDSEGDIVFDISLSQL